MKKLLTAITLIALNLNINAQDIGLSTINNIWQKSTNNPAYIGNEKFIISLPGISTNVYTGGLTYDNIIGKNTDKETVIDSEKLLKASKKQNQISASLGLETLGVAFGGKKWQAHLSHAIRVQAPITIPKNLLEAAFLGNAHLVGETVNIAPSTNFSIYSETGVGFAWKFEKLTLGLKAKALNGIANISTSNNQLNLTTSEKYHLTIASNYTINSAGITAISGLNNMGSDSLDINILDDSKNIKDAFSRNKGFAIDLGATYKINDKISLSGSILDIGRIHWENNAKSYTSNGTYKFKGLDISDIVDGNKIDLEVLQDSILNNLNFKESENSFKRTINARTYWTVDYTINERLNVGGLINTLHANKKISTTAGIHGNVNFGDIFSLGTIASHGQSSGFALGGNMALRLGPIHLFALADNLLALNSVSNQSFVHFRTGLNIAFGKRHKKSTETVNPAAE